MISVENKLHNARRRVIFERHIFLRRLKGEKPIIHLYSKDEIKQEPSRVHAKIIPFIIGANAPTAIICPGGAYQFISYNNEGAEYAKALNKRGYNAFMLSYRVGYDARFPFPMEDLARAICFVKHNAKAYGINADTLYLFGSSAGGHLAACFSAKYKDFPNEYCGKSYNLKPTGLVLSYPVITMGDYTHELSRTLLLGLHSTEKKRRATSVELIADSDFPPTFFWHCEGDETVPIKNSEMLDERLNEVGVKHWFSRYPHGGHGIGLGVGTVAEGWINDAVQFLKSIDFE